MNCATTFCGPHSSFAARTVGRIRARWQVASGLLGLFVCGCSGDQSALNPVAEQADRISSLWWCFFAVCCAVYGLVLLILLTALVKRRPAAEPKSRPDEQQERRMSKVVGGAVAITVVLLFFLLIEDLAAGHVLYTPTDPHPVRVQITGRQWWWEIKYETEPPEHMVTTANEIHVPVGKTVQFELRSSDVIHSFWAPNFHGKKDMVPGHPATNWFKATRAGTYWGQCAEFCGYQHAHMRFVVIAEPEDKFNNWLEAQRKPGAAPSDELSKRGEHVFESGSCVLCHTVAGTPARGTVGPNLTHIASRPTLAAGAVVNNLGHLGGWILDPQQVKPGVHMPQNSLSASDLRALLAYLAELK